MALERMDSFISMLERTGAKLDQVKDFQKRLLERLGLKEHFEATMAGKDCEMKG